MRFAAHAPREEAPRPSRAGARRTEGNAHRLDEVFDGYRTFREEESAAAGELLVGRRIDQIDPEQCGEGERHRVARAEEVHGRSRGQIRSGRR